MLELYFFGFFNSHRQKHADIIFWTVISKLWRWGGAISLGVNLQILISQEKVHHGMGFIFKCEATKYYWEFTM